MEFINTKEKEKIEKNKELELKLKKIYLKKWKDNNINQYLPFIIYLEK